MKKEVKKNKNGQIWKAALVILAVFAWAAIPLLTQTSVKASGDEIPVSTITANLTSPSGGINPHGLAAYEVYQGGNRELEIEAEDVNAADGTVLSFFVNGNQVGQAALSGQRAKLKLESERGQTVPTINNGSTVQVKNGGNTVILSGVFGGGNPTPSPSVSPSVSPTASPSPNASPSPTVSPSPNAGDLFAALNGSPINGVLPLGFAQYELHDSRRELEIRIRQINLPAGTSLGVFVNNISVGQIVVDGSLEGRLRLRTDRGDNIPVVTNGLTIQIKNGANSILTGSFTGMISPGPSPSPNPSPNPALGRYFEAHLNGAGVTPPITTTGRGEVKVFLSQDQTSVQVTAEFAALSSAQSSAKVFVNLATATLLFDMGAIGGTQGHIPSKTFPVTPAQVQLLRTGLAFAVIGTQNNPNGEIQGQVTMHSNSSDFDGDGSNDVSVFRPSDNTWYVENSQGFATQVFGNANDKLVSGDYDGDGKTDAAVFQNINGAGVWQVRRSSDGGLTSAQFGFASDTPVRGDFDGDGRTDLAVFRANTGTWYIQKSDNTGFIAVQFGASEDKPIATDLDGDGKDDIAVFRPSNGIWYWLRSSDGAVGAEQFGMNADIPIAGDFDGDGKTDLSVFRTTNGVWYIKHSSDGSFDFRQFGLGDDMPVAGNYDGDNKTDIAVFRPSTGIWYIWRSVDGIFDFRQFGMNGDIPVPSR